jgi:hypothetical protein
VLRWRLLWAGEPPEPIGYIVFIVVKHPHFGIRTAYSDAMYCEPKYRGTKSWLTFYRNFINDLRRDTAIDGILKVQAGKWLWRRRKPVEMWICQQQES